MQDETSRASLSMMIPRDQTVSSWYTWPLPHIVYRRQDTAHARHIAADVKGVAEWMRAAPGFEMPRSAGLGSEAGGVGDGRRGRRRPEGSEAAVGSGCPVGG